MKVDQLIDIHLRALNDARYSETLAKREREVFSEALVAERERKILSEALTDREREALDYRLLRIIQEMPEYLEYLAEEDAKYAGVLDQGSGNSNEDIPGEELGDADANAGGRGDSDEAVPEDQAGDTGAANLNGILESELEKMETAEDKLIDRISLVLDRPEFDDLKSRYWPDLSIFVMDSEPEDRVRDRAQDPEEGSELGTTD